MKDVLIRLGFVGSLGFIAGLFLFVATHKEVKTTSFRVYEKPDVQMQMAIDLWTATVVSDCMDSMRTEKKNPIDITIQGFDTHHFFYAHCEYDPTNKAFNIRLKDTTEK